jgi:peptide/nickel transport system substrate-binding protein
MAAAGYGNGFDAGEYYCDAAYANVGEAIVDTFQLVGIRAKLRPLERAAFFEGHAGKKFHGVIQVGSGAFGNAATRLEAFVVKGGTYVTGSFPDIDALFHEQAVELDHQKRTALLQKMQQLVTARAIFAPIWQLGFINGVGPRVGESGFGLIPGFAYTAPYEDITIKAA